MFANMDSLYVKVADLEILSILPPLHLPHDSPKIESMDIS